MFSANGHRLILALLMLVIGIGIAHGIARVDGGPSLVPLAIEAPDDPASVEGATDAVKACTSPPPVRTSTYIHCYAPADIAAAYGVDALHAAGNLGAGQTIVLVDAYGSPTAASDLQFFHDTFFASLPDPDFDAVFPFGAPDYQNTAHGNGQSGPIAAANWAGEAT